MNWHREWIRRFETPLRTLDALHLAIVAAYEVRLVMADQALVAKHYRIPVFT